MSEQTKDLGFYAGPDFGFEYNPGKTAVILIGSQKMGANPNSPLYSPTFVEALPRITSFLEVARNHELPVIHIASVSRGDGSDYGRLLDIRPMLRGGSDLFKQGTEDVEIIDDLWAEGDIIVQKRRYGSFYATDLDLVLRSMGIDTVVIIGMVTNGCCEETAREAFARDYKVIFPSDGNLTDGLPDLGWGPLDAELAQRVALTFIASSTGRVCPLAELEEEIMAKAASKSVVSAQLA